MPTQDRQPTGDGFYQQFTPLGGGSHYVEVDDAIGSPDDDTTYLERSDSVGYETFTYPVFNITSSAVAKVTINIRAKQIGAGWMQVAGRCKVGPLFYTFGSPAVISTSYADYALDQLTNPRTGLNWTEGDVEGVSSDALSQIGAFTPSLGAGETMRITQLYATVDYTAAASGIKYSIFGGDGVHSNVFGGQVVR